jgi:glutamate synthase (NADPH/NADH) small chain
MEFLKQQNKRVAGISFAEEDILATGKQVVVIGGGDTGSDCIGTSNRQRAKSITQFELLPKPPATRNKQMPWPTYPLLLKTTSSHEEGCERKWSVTTKEFINDGKGKLKALKIADVEWSSHSDGSFKGFIEVPGTVRELPCELALLAMGFLYPQKDGLLKELSLETDQKGNVITDEKSYQTRMPKVFSCGDMRRGQSLVVWAISEGRECARNVDTFLVGSSLLETKDNSLVHI